MSHGRETQPLLIIEMTPAEKAAIQHLADLEGVTPEQMAATLADEAAARRLRGQRRTKGEVRGFK